MNLTEPGKATRFVWFLGVSLVAMFAYVLVAPSLFRFVYPEQPALEFDAQIVAQLTTLLVGLVWWAIGSSQGAARKDELNAAQQARTVEALAPGSAAATAAASQAGGSTSALASGHAPTGSPDDPVSVKAAPGGMKP
jgi:hypothetical protein